MAENNFYVLGNFNVNNIMKNFINKIRRMNGATFLMILGIIMILLLITLPFLLGLFFSELVSGIIIFITMVTIILTAVKFKNNNGTGKFL